MTAIEDLLSKCKGFQWDEWNLEKKWIKHQVSWLEAEQVFFNQPLVVVRDEPHSQQEPRLYGLGQTDARRKLFVVFTVREELIRSISARDMSRRERKVYADAEKEKKDTQV